MRQISQGQGLWAMFQIRTKLTCLHHSRLRQNVFQFFSKILPISLRFLKDWTDS